MQNIIFDKTDKGREEIISRKYHLASRLRTLLVMVDGKHSSDDLLAKVEPLGLTQASVEELEQQGYIQRQSPSVQVVTTLDDTQNSQINSIELFQVLYDFYTETIKHNLGLRGYNIQFIVERASTLQDFHDLRAPFLDAINKSQSEKKALELRDQLDELLNIVPIKST
ncbi:hypothetical protein [Solimicrobium silvestre]|uniref:Uncharacterized protein n=1 Tax=Solimicrobium silvestre TaxID=2099400 RepID=A0A2S9GST9_9BURK|nr:hypothetical protein [Solimicrobium silvestre]PRC90771.1 hypothetical protein S2091_4519 [Solimicrobium silvestre]